MASSRSSLVAAFDEIVAASEILNGGSEKEFSEFVANQIGFCEDVNGLKHSMKRLNEKIEAKDIELKLSRNSLEKQMNKCAIQEERIKEYDKQFMILKVLLSADDKLINLNEAERRSLALLRQRQSLSSPGFNCIEEEWGTPETSVNVTDATDLDDDEGERGGGYRAHWKRRRTASSEWTLDSSNISKRKRSVEASLVLSDQPKESLDLVTVQKANMTPPLEKQFKRPPPNKNRRKPSRGHLINRNFPVESTPPSIVPPLNLPREEDDCPLPSAPPEMEVALVNSGILSPCSNEGTPPPHSGNPDIYAAYPHSPLSPLSVQPQPSSPSVGSGSPRLYPVLEQENMDYVDYGITATPTKSQPSLTRTNSDINMTRKHTFQSKTALKLENCEVCKKRVNGFGKNFLKCQECRAVCCVDCQNKVPLPCVPTVRTPKKKQKDSELSAYCPNTIPRVPSLIVHCVKELESRGLTQVGLYRVPGSDRNIKELKERLLRSKGTPSVESVDDVNVFCGCIKQFFIGLKEPLITHKLNPLFFLAVQENTEEKILAGLLEAIAQLPPCNKDTLAFIILHLQKIIERAERNQMPLESIAKVFGPTLVGSTSSDPALAIKDLPAQKAVMERLLTISPNYWRQYLSTEEGTDYDSPRDGASVSTPMFNSPSTPELMPIPQSPFLGPCQSPRTYRPQYGASYARTPIVPRSISANPTIPSSVTRSAKKNGYFAAIN